MPETLVEVDDFPMAISETIFVDALKVFTEAIGFNVWALHRLDLRIGEVRATIRDGEELRDICIPIGEYRR